MRPVTTINLKQYEDALATIGKNAGAKGFASARKSFDATVLVVNDDGLPIDLSTVDIEIKSAADDSEPVEQGALAEIVKSAVAAELRKSAEVVKSARGRLTSTLGDENAIEAKRISFPTGGYRAKFFERDSQSKKDEAAYRFGVFALAHAKSEWANTRCKELAIPLSTKAHLGGVNSQGGAFVPDEFAPDIIRLVEDYGVFRRHARVRRMESATLDVSRRVTGLTAYWKMEGGAGTESTLSADRIKLVAKELMVLTTQSLPLGEDAISAFGDLLAQEAALAISYKEDVAGFIGDGTSTYGGIYGVVQKLTDVNGFDSGGGVQEQGATGLWPTVTLADITALMGRCKRFPGMVNKFYCSNEFYGQVLLRLSISPMGTVTGGTGSTFAEMQNTSPVDRFLGFPVVITQAMATSSAADTCGLLFGDLSYAATFGDRMQITFGASDSALNAFEQNETAFRWVSRCDINVHDIGDSTTSGPIVGLVTQGS